jgi:Arc/MetJ family transcription regulator
MATNLHLDAELIDEAVSLGGHRSKKEAVNAALAAYIAEMKRRQAVQEFGSFDFDEDFDYKKARSAS